VGVEVNNGRKKLLNKENILSVSVKIFGEPEYIMTVSRKNFSPQPRVDSAILGIYNISEDFFVNNQKKEKDFFDFVKLIFGNKRKTLIKNIGKKYEKHKVEQILKNLNLNLKIRAEDLTIEQLKKIFNAI
jgi:16S rRNA (adenine1518-N6/adenine1519-N6)-dimethyltransferase